MSRLPPPPKCGICCLGGIRYTCLYCHIDLCVKCSRVVKLGHIPANIRMCALCSESEISIIPLYRFYCECCDTCVILDNKIIDRCVSCSTAGKTLKNRALLPHRNARPIIETYFIPEIAKLIFDYYYRQRRYLSGEF